MVRSAFEKVEIVVFDDYHTQGFQPLRVINVVSQMNGAKDVYRFLDQLWRWLGPLTVPGDRFTAARFQIQWRQEQFGRIDHEERSRDRFRVVLSCVTMEG